MAIYPNPLVSMPGYSDRASILQGAGDMIFKLVLERSTPKQWAAWLRAPLEHAAGTGNYDLVERLLKAGADGSAGWRGCDHNTLLHAGAQGGNERVVSALIGAGAGADVHAKGCGKAFTPLHLAALGGKTAAASTLVLAGADVNSHNSNNNNTPLYLAIKHGHLRVAESLLSLGADASIQSPQGTYPIHLAAFAGYDEVVTKLLQNGATSNCLDAKGRTPLRLAASAGSVSTMKALLAGGGSEANRSPALHVAACSDDAATIRELLHRGADVDRRNEQDLTPLLSAAYLGSRSACLALLEGGAGVNSTTIDGSTPLHAACCRGDYHMADLLLKRGADPDATDNGGAPPGKWMPKASQTTCSAERRQELARLSELLLATACRRETAWRRRGYLVMCRAYPSRCRISLEASQAGDGHMQPPRRSSRRMADVGTEVEGANEGQAAGGGTETGDGFGGVMAWLMELKNEDEDAFRSIVGFL